MKAGERTADKSETVTIRAAAPADASVLREIYAWYVENTAVSFEYAPPSVGEFRARMENTLKKYPYLAAEAGGELLGYAYAGPFHPRAAYGWCAELSVYLRRDVRGRGIGRALYTAAENALREMGVVNLYACVASPAREDEYLTHDSERFHAAMGFERVGVFHSCGYKFGRWYDMVWMEKLIGPHGADQREVLPFPEIYSDSRSSFGFLQLPKK